MKFSDVAIAAQLGTRQAALGEALAILDNGTANASFIVVAFDEGRPDQRRTVSLLDGDIQTLRNFLADVEAANLNTLLALGIDDAPTAEAIGEAFNGARQAAQVKT